MSIQVDRAKYLDIMKTEGLSAALTALHHEMWKLENECFETPEGYNPNLFEDLKKFREFSRELFEMDPTRSGPAAS